MNMNNTATLAISKNYILYLALLAGASLALAACSTSNEQANQASAQAQTEEFAATDAADQNQVAPAAGEDVGISDPFEGTNRAVFKFNNAVDKAVINPVVKGYRTVVPQPARTGLRNFLRNLKSPTILANQLLQGDIEGAGATIIRAGVNSTIGIGGLIDVAATAGLPYEQEDFGQTLGVWGVGHGPYLVVPVLGPSSLRDYAGYFVDAYADPIRWWLFNTDNEGWYYAKVGVEYLDLRESLLDVLGELEKSSIDYYAAVRSTYYQRREALVNDEMGTAIPDFDE
jgi:phospholipid-binding lipoprotein MlaA